MLTFNWLWSTEPKRLSNKAGEADAHGHVVDHSALCVLAASPRTWVLTLVAHTRLVRGTVRVDCTLRSTTLVRVAKVFREASTRSSSVLFSTHSVGTAGGRGAWSHTLGYRGG